MLVDAKTGLYPLQSPLCAHMPSCPIGAIPAAKRSADQIHTFPIPSTTARLNSNPDRATPTPPTCQPVRGFLLGTALKAQRLELRFTALLSSSWRSDSVTPRLARSIRSCRYPEWQRVNPETIQLVITNTKRTTMSNAFKALMLTEDDAGKTVAEVRELTNDDLPAGDVLIAVDYSSLNYKDGLAITGKGKIVHTWPMVGCSI